MKRIHWQRIYGAILVAMVVASLLAAALNADALLQDIGKRLRDLFRSTLPILVGIYVLFSLLERLVQTAGPRKPVKGYWLNINVTLLYFMGFLLGIGTGYFIAAIGRRLPLGWIDLRFSTGYAAVDLILTLLLTVFIIDFFFYWSHRFQHESVLWQEHKLHHMDEQLCVFSTYRHHWLEVFTGTISTVASTILFRLNPVSTAIAFAVYGSWNAFIHSNIKLHWGPIAILLTGPQVHRIHHSRLPEHRDKNYAAVFPILDVIFGTYHYPKRNEYPPTGVHDETEVKSAFDAALLPFREWLKMLHRWRRQSTAMSR